MLAQNENPAEEAARLREIFAQRQEWLLSDNFSLQTEEIEISEQNGKIILSCLTRRGWQSWRVLNWKEQDEKLIFALAPKINSPAAQLEFVPRISALVLREDLNAARMLEARKLAELARGAFSPGAKIERIGLSRSSRRGQRGTMARVLLSTPNGKTIAVCGSILPKTEAESLLSSAILWLTKTEEKRRIAELRLIADDAAAKDLQNLAALLRAGWRERIKIYARSAAEDSRREDAETLSEEKEILSPLAAKTFADLWREKPRRITKRKSADLSETAAEILNLAPDEIDVVGSKYGETLRFYGLPFARVRQVVGAERAWFGLEGTRRQILDAAAWGDFENLLENLRRHRRADATDKKNFLRRAAPESWLEAVLRRDVSRLDPNLILAPLHAQFRLSNKAGALDLLALRTDGRLVVIELKVAPDREHVFQAVNYWRQIEAQRRAGNIENAGLFADLKIAAVPPLVYLVAPLLSFQRDTDVLAAAVTPEIELWRFDLNEDWRREIRVTRRQRIN